jgi:hypothetical protein
MEKKKKKKKSKPSKTRRTNAYMRKAEGKNVLQ